VIYPASNTNPAGRLSTPRRGGYSLIVVVGLVALMLTLLTGLTRSVVNENWLSLRSRDSDAAFHIAEAGINYYTWFLNHHSGDFQNGLEVEGPYIQEFEDGLGNKIGYFWLEMEEPAVGSTIGTVTSTGALYRPSAPPRTVRAQIGVPSLARFAFLTNSDVWFGASESLDGMLHSNGGIRFDGSGNGLITSAKETYTCQNYHGCTPAQTRAGIWGSGGPQSLWSFPVPTIDFDLITGHLSLLETLAQSAEGLFLGTTTGQFDGYHLILNSGGTADPSDDTVVVNRVRQTWQNSGYTLEGGWQNYRDRIRQEQYFATYTMPENGVIFVDDDVWVSGETSSRVTIAAAHFPEQVNNYRSIVVANNLRQYTQDGSAVIGLIAQKDVRLAADSPNNIDIHAVMMAQKGKVIRPFYNGSILNTIQTYGGIITNQVWTWTWVNGSGAVISGYENTHSDYDPHLIYSPPPHFPTTGQYEVLQWEEIRRL